MCCCKYCFNNFVKIFNSDLALKTGTVGSSYPAVDSKLEFGKMDILHKLTPQAGSDPPEATISQPDGWCEHENIEFCEDTNPFEYSVGGLFDPTRRVLDSGVVSLENFFKRPIKIFSATWQTSTNVPVVIDPWELFFENPRVSNRISNYNCLRANLHVKIVVNGTPFHYGRKMVSYYPQTNADQTFVPPVVYSESDLVQYSQLPHVFLNPTTSSGGDLVLPMFHNANYLSIPNGEWRKMGRLIIINVNPLKSISTNSSDVDYTMYAWATDVELTVLTSQPAFGLVPQMGEIEEVSRKGYISSKLSSVASVAAALSKVPTIAPYALATATMAAGASSMFKLFGYSRPIHLETSDVIIPKLTSNLASTLAPDRCSKLTVDPKQELTIDPRIATLSGEDTFTINSIAGRESYLTSFNWSVSNNPEALIWNMRVDPTHVRRNNLGFIAMPACAVAAIPFDYWTGTMKVRFQIVCSAYHKGRLRIVYDPNSFDTTPEYNINHMQIHDIEKTTDFSISIAVAANKTFLEHSFAGVTPESDMFSTLALASAAFGNGILGVYVGNRLVTSGDDIVGDLITVNVYISMEKDFEVAVPNNYFASFIPRVPQPVVGLVERQMGSEDSSSINDIEHVDRPVLESSELINPPRLDKWNANTVYFGERITSFRQLIKRNMFWTGYPLIDTTTGDQVCVQQIRSYGFPFYRGPMPNAIHKAGTYNFCNMTLLHWITLCHSGWRGSIRYKIMPFSASSDISHRYAANVELNSINGAASYSMLPLAPVLSRDAAAALFAWTTSGGAAAGNVGQQFAGPGASGMDIATGPNNCLDFEVPYYSNFRFTPGKVIDWTGPRLTGQKHTGYYLAIRTLEADRGAIGQTVSAGEDFQCYFWTGMPYMSYSPQIPNP